MMLEKELAAVKEFQNLFDVTLAPAGTPLTDAPPGALALNKRICEEEIEEMRVKGVLADNLIEIADGGGDSVYVLGHAVNQLGRVPNAGRAAAAAEALEEARSAIDYALGPLPIPEDLFDKHLAYAEIIVRGVAAVYGIPLDKVFTEIHRSNMTKVWEDGKGRKDAGGKVLKPAGYSKPDLAAVLGE